MKSKLFIIELLILSIILITGGCDESTKLEEVGDYIPMEYLKFSDFGCDEIPWSLKSEKDDNYYIVYSQEDLKAVLADDDLFCIPEIDFSNYFVIVGDKVFPHGVKLYEEKLEENLEENNLEIVFTITYQVGLSQSIDVIKYDAVIKKPSVEKNIRVVVLEKDNL